MTMDFTSISNEDMADTPDFRPLPEGTYLCTHQSWREGVTPVKQTPYIEATFKIVQPYDDVNVNELEAMGGIGNRTLRKTFYTSEAAKPWLKRYLIRHLGIKETKYHAALEAAINREVLVHVKHTINDDGDIRAEVDRTASVD